MKSKILVGVFWLCDDGASLDIIYDKEEYALDEIANLEDEFVTYSKQHADVWNALSQKFFSGKYQSYLYDDFPRGRIWYDSEEDSYSVVCDYNLRKHIDDFRKAVNDIFNLEDAEYSADAMYRSKMGKYN